MKESEMSKVLNISAATAALIAAVKEVKEFDLDETRAEQLVREHNIKSQKKAEEVAQTVRRPSANKGRIRTERVIEPGPRGFRFHGKWNESVASGEGIALHPFYWPKLKAHAAAFDIKVAPAKKYDAEMAKELCEKIVKAGGPEVPVAEEMAA
jgi:hypothetical protein